MNQRDQLVEQYYHWQSLVEEVLDGYLTWDEADRDMGEFIAQQKIGL